MVHRDAQSHKLAYPLKCDISPDKNSLAQAHRVRL